MAEVPAPAGARRRFGAAFSTPAVLTGGLTAALALIGVLLSRHAPSYPLLHAPRGTALLLVVAFLAAAFVATELGQALVEVRSQAYSFSLAGVPLLLGLLYVPPLVLIGVRVACALVVFVAQRSSGLKLAYNTAAYLLDTALVVTLLHLLVSPADRLTLTSAVAVYATLAVVDVVMSSLVLVVIRINQGPLTGAECVDVLVPASVFVVLNTVIGLDIALLMSHGLLGASVLLILVLLITVAYRAYLVLRRRHHSLQVVQQFVADGEHSAAASDLTQTLLTSIQTLVRATSVELELHTTDAGAPGQRVRLASGPDGAKYLDTSVSPRPDEVVASAMLDGEALLITDAAPLTRLQRQWLQRHEVDDALVVPFSQGDASGALLALGRIGDTTRFTPDDLALLTTLTGHLAVALHNRRLVERLRVEATHDVLTGLPNRALLIEHMTTALDQVDHRPCAVLLLDLNRFKDVNDAFGHHVGDQLLQVVGRRLRGLDLPDSTIARLGGDEFAVLLRASQQVDGPARDAAARIATALSAPIELPDATVTTAASIGIAMGSGEQTHQDLLRHADTAMYAAKDTHLPFVIYTEALDRGRAERLGLLADLRSALDRDELQMHYQPKLDLGTGQVTSVEALVRWTHPMLGPLSPAVFIPLAESTGLIEQLTAAVLTKALRDCRAWRDAGHDVRVAVNLSARNVNDAHLPQQVFERLGAAGLLPEHLILEITESAVMGDPERTVPVLNRLVELGVTLSLDDFGTGYSSLAYLQRLPVTEVKIDRSFVMGLSDPAQGRASAALVRSIVGIGSALGLHVVAEGVEDQDTLVQLRSLGCDIAQGFHLARPVPLSQLPRTVEALERRYVAVPAAG